MTGTQPKGASTVPRHRHLDLSDTMVLFDWNGTIVLDSDRARDALNSVLLRRNLPELDERAFSARFKLPMAAMFIDLGVPGNEVTAAEGEWNQSMAAAATVLRDGVVDTLTQLSRAGALLRVLSAASAEAVRFDQISLNVPAVFTGVEAPVIDKLERLRTHRAERTYAFYVGDTAYDMRSATGAGFTPIGVSGGYAPTEALWDAGAAHIIHSLTELTSLLSPASEKLRR